MLYTILDPNEVLLELPNIQSPQFEWLKRENCVLQCVKQDGTHILDRIISTNPRDYLNPRYKIGQKIQK